MNGSINLATTLIDYIKCDDVMIERDDNRDVANIDWEGGSDLVIFEPVCNSTWENDTDSTHDETFSCHVGKSTWDNYLDNYSWCNRWLLCDNRKDLRWLLCQ